MELVICSYERFLGFPYFEGKCVFSVIDYKQGEKKFTKLNFLKKCWFFTWPTVECGVSHKNHLNVEYKQPFQYDNGSKFMLTFKVDNVKLFEKRDEALIVNDDFF